jgi:signal peptidase
MRLTTLFQKFWHFLWREDSLFSWIVNLLLAFVLVKWVIYPLIGLLFSTSYPIVAVVSGSMEHDGLSFAQWWERNSWYQEHEITQEAFASYSFSNGFNKGDIMILHGAAPKSIKRGDVLVYENPIYRNPIIHRVVEIRETDGSLTFITKGDNNPVQDQQPVTPVQITRTGKAILRIPYLGWIKIGFANLLGGI